MVGKPVVVTRVVDSMTDNLRPTRAEATDVAKQCWMVTSFFVIFGESSLIYFDNDCNTEFYKL